MKVPILRIRGEDGQMHSIPAIKGDPGKDGAPGPSPDMAAIVQAVLAALPDADAGSY